MVRKSALTGGVLLIEPRYGILRVVFALLLCLVDLVTTTAARPYLLLERNLIATLSALSLFFTFLAVLFVKIYSDLNDAEFDPAKIFGFGDVFPFTIVLLIFNFLALGFVTCTVGIELWQLRSLPRIRLCSTREMPELKLAHGDRFHSFMSHAW